MNQRGRDAGRDGFADPAREAFKSAAVLIAMLAVAKPLVDGALGLVGGAFTLAAAYQLFVPIDRLDRRRIELREFGIHAHGLIGAPLRSLRALVLRAGRRGALRPFALGAARFLQPYTRGVRLDGSGAGRDAALVVGAVLVTFPPFAVGYTFFQEYLAPHGMTAVFELRMPEGIAGLLATHILLVAVPEEVFYRGYIHTLLARAWPPRFTVLGAGVGRAVVVGSALFALGHFVGEWNPFRLGPFFPALLFCALRSWSGSIAGAVVFHGLCNVMGEVMRASVRFE